MILLRGFLSVLLPWLFAGMALTGKETEPRNKIQVDFDAHPDGAYEMRIFRRDWANAFLGKFHQRASITAEPKGKSLRVTYPKGSLGPNEGGGVFRQKLPPLSSRSLSYRVLFEKGFDFRRGGKLPGLGGGKANTGGNKPTGDGWSARYMWGEDGKLLYERCYSNCSPRYTFLIAEHTSGYAVRTEVHCGLARDRSNDRYRISTALRRSCPVN